MRTIPTIMRTCMLTAATAVAMTGAGGALAADLYYEPPPAAPSPIYEPTPVYDWSGFYIGIQGGGDWNHATTPPSFAANENGGIAGLYGGYNWQYNNVVFGVDGSINYSWASGGDPTIAGDSAGPTWKGLIRGRLGYAIDRFLIYGTAGAAGMGYTATVSGVGTGTASPWGWTVGAGVEAALRDNITARLDYAYQDYGTFTLSGAAPVGGTSVSVKSHTLMAGIAFKW